MTDLTRPRERIPCSEFTVADIMMSCVLRDLRKTDKMTHLPKTPLTWQIRLVRRGGDRQPGFACFLVAKSRDLHPTPSSIGSRLVAL